MEMSFYFYRKAMRHMIYEYCERHGSGPFEEPFNTISNLVFIWAAVEAWNVAGRHKVRTPGMHLLIFLAATVGIGSAIWHVFATPWASLMDLIPILLFQLCFLWLYLRICGGMKAISATGLVCGYLVISVPMLHVPRYLNGSILYGPTVVVLLCLAVFHYATDQPDRRLMGVVAMLFSAAITFRSIDLLACRWVPFGTHFLWHVFNGAVFYCAMRAIVLKRANQKPVMAL
jgi:hypothetical protein